MTGDRGQAIVEFALVVPLLLVLILGVVLVAEIGVARLALEHAAAEAARTGALTNDDELIRSTAAAAVTPLDASLVKVIIEPTENEGTRSSMPRGSLLRIRLRYAIPVPLGFAGLPRLIVEGTAARRVEWTP
jgi:Flp pilus assembly protein TadG